jgi:anti-sigma factor RsiW
MHTCTNTFGELVFRHLLGELDVAEVSEFHSNLLRCRACRRRHRAVRQMIKPKEEDLCPTCEGLLVAAETEMGETAAMSRPELYSGVIASA